MRGNPGAALSLAIALAVLVVQAATASAQETYTSSYVPAPGFPPNQLGGAVLTGSRLVVSVNNPVFAPQTGPHSMRLQGPGFDQALIGGAPHSPLFVGEFTLTREQIRSLQANMFSFLATAADIPFVPGVFITVTVSLLAQSPPTTTRYLLPEGATGSFFETEIHLASPDFDTPVTLTFLRSDGTPITLQRTLNARSRETIRVGAVPGLENSAPSTVVTAPSWASLMVERVTKWDATGYGAHSEKALEEPRTTMYFAEGVQNGYFSTFLLLANAGNETNIAYVTYLRDGAAPVEREYSLEPSSRRTIDAATDPDLVGHSFSAIVNFSRPAAAERVTYFGSNPIWRGGHASSGAAAPATSWMFAEGATGTFFSTYLLLMNPQDDAADVSVKFLRDDGQPPVTTTSVVPARQRRTIDLSGQNLGLGNASVGMIVDANLPIVAERAQYWPNPDWAEGHGSAGMVQAGTRWGLAAGSVGGTASEQTYILLANPGPLDADATLTFIRADGATLTKTTVVRASSRRNVAVAGPGSDVPELADEFFSTIISSTQPIVVERSTYWNAGGQLWAAGTNTAGTTLLPLP